MRSPRLICPLCRAACCSLGGCQTVPAWATIPPLLSGWATMPRAYTASQVSQAQRTGIAVARRAAGGPRRRRGAGPGRQRGRRGHRHVLRPDRDLSGGGGTGRRRHLPGARCRRPGAREFDFLTTRRQARRRLCRAGRGARLCRPCRSFTARCPGSAMSRRAKPMPPPAFPFPRRWRARLASAQNHPASGCGAGGGVPGWIRPAAAGGQRWSTIRRWP